MADNKKKKSTSAKKKTPAKGSSKYTRTPAKTAQKGEEQSKPKKNIDALEVIRWVLALFALFIIITFFPNINSGIFGPNVSNVLKGLFGPMYYVLPFVLICIVVFWKKDRENNTAAAKYLLYAGEFIFVSIIAHVIVAGDMSGSVPFSQLYNTGINLASAGLIGGTVAKLFVMAIGKVASVIIAVVGAFVFGVLLCGKTPKSTVLAIVKYFRESIRNAREAQEYEEYEDEEYEEEPRKKNRTPAIPEEQPARKPKRSKRDGFVELPDDPNDSLEPPFDIEKPENQPITSAPLQEDPYAPVEELAAEPVAEPMPEPVAEVQQPEPAAEVTEVNEEMEVEEEELFLDHVDNTTYVFPPITLLAEDTGANARPNAADVARTARRLEELLLSFNVKTKVIDTTFGPTVTRYELQPEVGVRVKSIVNLADDISLHLAAEAVRIENIPGKAAVGIEIPNKNASMVRLRRLIENTAFTDAKSRLYTALGEDVGGNPVYLDIAKMPHLLVAGATGQGKSVCINSLILSLLYRNHPNDVKLILIDPKTVEFADFKDIPHLLVPVINDPKSAAGTLNWACTEMEKRYRLIQEVGARNLEGYNIAVADDPERENLPQIVIFIDEFADLMMTAPDDVETSVCRLAQKARAAGMHLVIGTQRPSVDVITGLIKANIPSRIALTTASPVDSRTIIEQVGAEKLLGKGDMLYFPVGAMKPTRVQGAFVSSGEVQAVTQYIKEAAHAQYDESIMKQIEDAAKLCGMKGKKALAEVDGDAGNDKLDPKFMEALEIAIDSNTISTSMIQARLALGYGRASRIISVMERRGYIGEFDAATKKRKILITREQFAELKLNGDKPKEGE